MSKIEWCDLSWNPVRGCLNTCKYCYARDMNNRFKEDVFENEARYFLRISESLKIYKKWSNGKESQILFDNLQSFKPTWLEHQFQKKLPNKPKRIFIGSMSDICYWKPKWMERILEKIKRYPQHTFMFLTKFPEVYLKYKFPINCWLGVTITDTIKQHVKMMLSQQYLYKLPNKYYLSLEPFHGHSYRVSMNYQYWDWVIIGSETGNRKNKIITKREWVLDIAGKCIKKGTPIFLKDNLKPVWGEKLIQEVPNEK